MGTDVVGIRRLTVLLLIIYRLAATIFQQLVASDESSQTFASLKRLHGSMPYFMMKTVLKVSNPISMIRGWFPPSGLRYAHTVL